MEALDAVRPRPTREPTPAKDDASFLSPQLATRRTRPAIAPSWSDDDPLRAERARESTSDEMENAQRSRPTKRRDRSSSV